MTTREFIAAIANGDLMESEIIEYADNVYNKKELLFDLYTSDKYIWERIGKPQIETGSKAWERVFGILCRLSKRYQIYNLGDVCLPDKPEVSDLPQNPATSEQIQYKPIKKKGRRNSANTPFSDLIMVDHKDEILQKLHRLIDGKELKIIALVIKIAQFNGLILKPTSGQMKKEFNMDGCISGYNRWVKKNEECKSLESLERYYERDLVLGLCNVIKG